MISLALITSLGYFGVFLISLISTSTLFLPIPIYAIITFSSTLGLNPFLVALFSGLGMALGEITGYLVGLGGGSIILRKNKKLIRKFEFFFKRFGFITISFFAFIPFPFDIIGILAGVGRYDLKKFLLATFIGKFFKALFLSLFGFLIRDLLVVIF